jgi:hypothetical protein
MPTKLARMKLREILENHGIHTIRQLCEKTGLPRQQGWMLWWGKAGVGKVMAKRLHEKLGIPLEELLDVDPVPYTWPRPTKAQQSPKQPNGRPPKRQGNEGPAHE